MPPKPPQSKWTPLQVATRPELSDLYRALGTDSLSRERKLGEILTDFYQAMASDPMLGFFFDGKDLATIAMRQKQFLMRAMGASPSYTGKPPALAHERLAPILVGHFDRRLQILSEVLRRHGLSEDDINTWLGFENTFRQGIVSKSGN